jgi:DNA modification methylase
MMLSNRTKLLIEDVPIGAIKADPKSPRIHSKRKIQQLARAMDAFGYFAPIVVDANGNVVSGHARLLAAILLGMETVPVIRLAHLTPAQARALQIADNKLAENATWDKKLLGQIFVDLSVELEFPCDITGFENAEIDILIEGLEEERPSRKAGTTHGEAGPPTARDGDMFLLGPHKILCANSLEPSSYEQLMGDTLAHIVFADVPYNVPIRGHVSGLGAIQHAEFAMASGEMTPAQFTEFLKTAFGMLVRYSTNGSIHYVCNDWRHLQEMLAAGADIYSELKNICVWVKDNGGMGSLYRSQHELVFAYKNGKAPHQNNVQLGKYGRNRTNVWNYPGVGNFGRQGGEGNLLAVHPTVKPVELIADALQDCSSRGNIVLDSFLGSGSTLLAAERVGRVCRGIEIAPGYIDAAVRRWERYTGERAILAATGQCFAELSEERLAGVSGVVDHV